MTPEQVMTEALKSPPDYQPFVIPFLLVLRSKHITVSDAASKVFTVQSILNRTFGLIS